MKLTKEILSESESCLEGYRFAIENDLMEKEFDEVISYCTENGKQDFADWLNAIKQTELYVRNNGSIFTMGAYQVFNPFAGQHTRYDTESEAQAALLQIAKELLKQYCPQVVRELTNENGDVTWVKTQMTDNLTVNF